MVKNLFQKSLVAVALFGAIACAAHAADVYVIANNAAVPSAEDVRDIFIGEKQILGGNKVIPMDNSSLQRDFLDKAVKLESGKYSAIWAKKGFREGLNPPAMKSSDAEVISAVKSTPGAVGYVSTAPVGVKVVQKY